MTHLQLLALGIPYSGNTKVRFDPSFSLDTFYTNKCNFCYPFLPLLGVLSGVKATLRLLTLVIPYSGTLRYDSTLVLELLFYINICQFCYPFLLHLFGLRSGVKPSLRSLHWSVRTRRRSLRYAMSVILTLVLLHKWITIVSPLFTHFGVAVRGKATLEMLLFIPCSENTIR